MKRTSYAAIPLALMLATGLLFPGCKHKPTAADIYGRAANADRKLRGLPIIPPEWNDFNMQPRFANWGNPLCSNWATTNGLMHRDKGVEIDDSGRPISEGDSYQSGKQYHTVGSDPGEVRNETLTINYNFEAARAGKNPWSCEINCGPHYEWRDGVLTLDEAEAILKEWGLNRLNY